MIACQPTVSVIIAACNGEIEHLNRTVNSVLRQTYANFEILVYGDRTLNPQADPNLVRDFRLRYIFQTDSSIFQIFNRGIAEAQGKYITFLRVDDFWHSSKLSKQVACLNEEPEIGLVYSWIVPIDSQGKSRGRAIKYAEAEDSRTDILQRNRIHYQSVMVRRSCFDTVGLFDLELELEKVRDWDMWIRLNRHYQFIAIAQPLVFCWQQANSGQNWLVMEINLQQTLEKTYGNTETTASIALKNRSYAYASLHLAREVLQHQIPDPLIAGNYRRQALEHYPTIGFSLFFLRISLGVAILYCLKGDRYHQLQALVQASQSFMAETVRQLKFSTHALVKWMLTEEENFSLKGKIEQQGED